MPTAEARPHDATVTMILDRIEPLRIGMNGPANRTPAYSVEHEFATGLFTRNSNLRRRSCTPRAGRWEWTTFWTKWIAVRPSACCPRVRAPRSLSWAPGLVQRSNCAYPRDGADVLCGRQPDVPLADAVVLQRRHFACGDRTTTI